MEKRCYCRNCRKKGRKVKEWGQGVQKDFFLSKGQGYYRIKKAGGRKTIARKEKDT